MKGVVSILGGLVAIPIIIYGHMMSYEFLADSPEVGIPTMVIGVLLFALSLGSSWFLSVLETIIIIVGAIIIVVGLSLLWAL